jgi:LmbE family N-acetylglucosaminyl deacetylase
MRGRVRQLLALRAERGPYRFLVRKWSAISDVELAARVLGTEFFFDEITPLALPVTKLRSILVLAPHQDDDVIGAGGTLLIASAAGVKIDIAYVTDGASENPAYVETPAESARVRDLEAQEVCARLGATMHRIGISNRAPAPKVEDVDRLAELVQKLDPQVIMAPWILDSPPKHRLVNHLLWLAHHRCGLPDAEVWGYQVHNTLMPNGYVDITGVADQKRALLECFRSQNEFHTRYDHLAMGMAAWNARFFKSTVPRYIEIFFALPMSELLRLVGSFYFADLEATYRSQGAVVAGAKAIHGEVLGGRASPLSARAQSFRNLMAAAPAFKLRR